MLINQVSALADRLWPADSARRSPFVQGGHQGFAKDRQVEALRLAYTWAGLTIATAVIWTIVAAIADAISGGLSFRTLILLSTPMWFCLVGVVLQALRSVAAGILSRLQGGSQRYEQSRATHSLLTTGTSDLLIQLIVTVVIVALYVSVGLDSLL